MLAYHSLFTWSLVAFLTIKSNAVQNVTIPYTSPEITYVPFLCGTSLANSSTSTSNCAGGWQLLNNSAGSIVATDGPDPQTGSIIPQIFVSFRGDQASAVYLVTSPSNATANMTVSSTPSDIGVNIQLNSSINIAAVINLNETDLTTLAVTFLSSYNSSQLEIQDIIITVDNATASSSFLPTPSLPSSTPLTINIQTATSTSTSASATETAFTQRRTSKKELAEAFALVLGLGFGLTPIVAIIFVFWKRHHRKEADG